MPKIRMKNKSGVIRKLVKIENPPSIALVNANTDVKLIFIKKKNLKIKFKLNPKFKPERAFALIVLFLLLH